MEITWYGHSCFRLTERNLATVVTDPYDHKEAGYKTLALKADIVTVSQDKPGYNFIKAVKGADWHISGAGEYEIGGVFMTAVPTGNAAKNGKSADRNMVFTFDFSGINIVHLGLLKNTPTRNEIEAFGAVDVLLAPVGGGGGMNASKAAEVISLLEPGWVIPMHYKAEGSDSSLNSLNRFIKEMGLGKELDKRDSLKVTAGGIPEETRVVILNPKQ
ncbi:MAG: MBL fold metallo-hydrolase [Anaerolineae bacterium]|nr:MBL fold metallo-hydrolase [Anaerolineae bacterium]